MWKRPIKDMENYAVDIMIKAYEAYSYFTNECKYRGIRLRKKGNPWARAMEDVTVMEVDSPRSVRPSSRSTTPRVSPPK